MVYVGVYDEMPSPGTGSAYRHDRRQATLPTLMRLLKAAGSSCVYCLRRTTIMTTRSRSSRRSTTNEVS